jgi:3-phosphoshikimate 1-carboxyvinyltransferase
MSVANDLIVAPGGALTGTIVIPGDKSVSHRAVMFGALADGVCQVSDCLLGEDVLATMDAFRALGVTVDNHGDGRLTVHGVGVDGLRAPAAPLYLGNSGTSMRLLCGILAGAGLPATLTGDPSLSRRPMRRVTEPLNRMGARLTTAEGGTPPVSLAGGGRLTAIDYQLPVASAQVKSAVLLAGLYADGVTRVTEPAPTRDHTELMLRACGVELDSHAGTVSLRGGQRLKAFDIAVPADISSAAFFIVGAAIAPGSRLTMPAVGVNPTRTGVLDIMAAMGARIDHGAPRRVGSEPVADLTVHGSALRGIDIPQAAVPLAIDEFPAIFIAAACAEGRTVLRGAEELRHKESDRIAVMAEGLNALGIRTEVYDDGIAIDGGILQGGEIDAQGDHRIAMAFAVAALRAAGPITIRNAANIATSFPTFVAAARACGLRIAH